MKGKILVVEDDLEDVEMIQHAFEVNNWDNVLYFSNVFKVLEYLQTLDEAALPALLVTDYNMPKLNGFNLVAFLRRNPLYSSIKIIMIAGQLPGGEEERLLTAGVEKIYLKPSSMKEYTNIAAELVGFVKDKESQL